MWGRLSLFMHTYTECLPAVTRDMDHSFYWRGKIQSRVSVFMASITKNRTVAVC